MTLDDNLLRNPDAILFQKDVSSEVTQELTYFTVPLFFFHHDTDRENPSPEHCLDSGSGVLVNLQGHHFILTAGHCIKAYKEGPCAIGIMETPHRYMPPEWNSGKDDGRDVGYIYIPHDQVERFRAGSKIFLSEARLRVVSAGEIRKEDDWHVLTGFPGMLMARNGKGHGARILTYVTTLSGSGDAPDSRLDQPSTPVEYIDLWVPRENQVEPARDYATAEVPLLGGVSGGGCWKAGVRPDPNSWSVKRLQLVGIHVGSPREQLEHRFAREILIGHHLRLIAENIPELRKIIYEKWPILEEDRWAPLALASRSR